ncbi:fms interacting protein [Dissoconium aciculare CBS 342.82]|uniref:Fms interacting protein n=1 Tax=Dissoconium aciculare CBS 342.82 TaxID=1314786 RepID=A0A6J3M865_9PEZI|nr:fms interacting protein [Dissoconium aciculare CBS 342.82]KAF1824251.1 fms interacting protein [Dissoconium aciculare CBS 342.82]
MTTEQLVTDPALLEVLNAAIEARKQCLQIIDELGLQSQSAGTDLEAANFRMRKQMNAKLATLRGLNRKAVLGVRSTKQETTEARQEIDSLHLQLQNLYYEQRHLRGEIAACEDYDHKYQQLPMVPVDEFLSAHPEHAEASDHDLTIARIQDEHTARQALEEQRLALAKQKDVLVKETTEKKDELGKLDLEIEKWVAAQSNVRKIFDVREAAAAKVAELAREASEHT